LSAGRCAFRLVPKVSLGTHYFSDLVESDILYMALFPHQDGNLLNEAWFESARNVLTDLVDNPGQLADVVRVINTGDDLVILSANTHEQSVVCYPDHATE